MHDYIIFEINVHILKKVGFLFLTCFCVRNYSETVLNFTPSLIKISLVISWKAFSKDFSNSETLVLYEANLFSYFPVVSMSVIFFLMSSISCWITFTTGEFFRMIGAFKSLNVSSEVGAAIVEGIHVITGLNVSSIRISTKIDLHQ